MNAAFRPVGFAPVVLTLVASLVLPGCGPEGPSAADLRDALVLQLPSYLETSSFEVQERQNTGSEAEPAWTSNFKAELKLKESTYRESSREGDVLLVRRVATTGEARTVSGKALAGLTGKSWHSSISMDDDPTAELGQPLSEFKAARVIVLGSRDHVAYLEAKRMAALTAGPFVGVATGNGGARFPVSIRFTSYDDATRRVEGTVEWPSLGGVSKKFEGHVSDKDIAVRETEWVERGSGGALFPIEYRLELNTALDGVTGTWQATGYNGRLTLERR